MTSCIIDLKWRHTARAHVTQPNSEILHSVQIIHMYLSQNNACKLNNCPHLLDKKLSNCHQKRFYLRNSVKYNFKFKHWRLYLLLGTFTGVWCDDICAYSVTSVRLPNQRVAQMSHDDCMMMWPDYKICNHFLAWKYRNWCWTEWSLSVAGGIKDSSRSIKCCYPNHWRPG